MKTKILLTVVATSVLATFAFAETTPVYNSKAPAPRVAQTTGCSMSANMPMHHAMKMGVPMKMASPMKCGMSCGM